MDFFHSNSGSDFIEKTNFFELASKERNPFFNAIKKMHGSYDVFLMDIKKRVFDRLNELDIFQCDREMCDGDHDQNQCFDFFVNSKKHCHDELKKYKIEMSYDSKFNHILFIHHYDVNLSQQENENQIKIKVFNSIIDDLMECLDKLFEEYQKFDIHVSFFDFKLNLNTNHTFFDFDDHTVIFIFDFFEF